VEPSEERGARLDAVSVETPEAVAFRLDLAGIGSRGFAFALDAGVVVLILAAEFLVMLAIVWALSEYAGYFTMWVLAVYAVVAFLTVWGYFIYFEYARDGRTWGKRTTGLRVVRDDGGRITFIDAAIRNLLRLVDWLPAFFGVGIVSAFLSRKGKRLGDYAAGTIVVRDSDEPLALYGEGRRKPLEAATREYLERRGDFTEEARYQVASSLLRAWGEDPGYLDEPTIAGRLADLSVWRRPVVTDEESA
jgi:uncharacterized RDD family membrane protein YckC